MFSCTAILPFDLIFLIATYLGFEDLCNLSNASPRIRRLMNEDIFNKRMVEEHITFTREAALARRGRCMHQTAARLVFDRREAIATGRPVSVCILGYASDMLYRQGTLCYQIDGVVRILDVHSSADYEHVIDLRTLDLSGLHEPVGTSILSYTLLNCCEGILVLLVELDRPARRSLLVAIRFRQVQGIETNDIHVIPLDNTVKIFARNDASFLCFGTHSGLGGHGHHEWMIYVADLRTGEDSVHPIQLNDFAGSDIGPTVFFEIIDGYFYALSNQTSFDVEEIDWTSYYHCYRFCLCQAGQEKLEVCEDIWRRNHEEGPINDSWTDLRLQRDSKSGDLMILETRREWLSGASSGQRTHYKQPLIWGERRREPEDLAKLSVSAAVTLSTGVLIDSLGTLPVTSMQQPLVTKPLSTCTGLSCTSIISTPTLQNGATTPASCCGGGPYHAFPVDLLTLTLHAGDRPNYAPLQARLARNVHPAEDKTPPSFILAKTKIRYNNPDSNSFLDLVDHSLDPIPESGRFSRRQYLRFRFGGRRRLPPARDPNTGLLLPEPVDPNTGERRPEMLETFASRSEGVTMWPALPTDNDSSEDKLIQEILNPIPCGEGMGEVHGVADERSVIYMTGLRGSKHKAIVLVNFDRAIHLDGRRALLPFLLPPVPEINAATSHDPRQEAIQQPWLRTENANYLTLQMSVSLPIRPRSQQPFTSQTISTHVNSKRKRTDASTLHSCSEKRHASADLEAELYESDYCPIEAQREEFPFDDFF